MINTQMKSYNYYLYGVSDAYGQQTLNTTAAGSVKMSINLLTKTISENTLYSSAQYIGLTLDSAISDNYVIQYGDDKLKVLYTNPLGRYTQVWMVKI